MIRLAGSLSILALSLTACGSPERSETADSGAPAATADAGAAATGTGQAAPTQVVATLQTAQGAAAGTATATASPDGGVLLRVSGEGLPPGEHGVHVHTTGRCDAPTFETAGGHWNPTSAQHGLENPQGQHAGDMPNMTVDANGRGAIEHPLKGATLAGLLEGDGSAFIVHASADDQRTDPSGDSGDRIACGVFASE